MVNSKDKVVEQIVKDTRNVQFGIVSITIHDGEITQVDVTEKKRFQKVKRTN